MLRSKKNTSSSKTIKEEIVEIRKEFVEKINDFEINFKKFHTAECRNARRKGMRDGNHNRPPADSTFLSSPEREIATAYSAQVAELAIDFGGFLERVKKDHVETLQQELNKINEHGISAEVNKILENKRQKLEKVEEEYHEKLDMLREDPNLKNLRQALDEVDDQLDEKSEKIGRRIGNELIKIHQVWYILLLIFVGFAEIAATYNAFLNFEEPPITTIIWAVGVGAVISIGAHFVGLGFSMGREIRAYIYLATFAALVILFALFEVSRVRAESIADIPVKHISLEAFLTISFAVFLIGVLLSFFTHDSNPKFQRLLRKYNHLKSAVQAKERAVFNQKQDLLEQMHAKENAIHIKYNDEIKSLQNVAQSVSFLLNEAITLHDEILIGLKNMEMFIITSYDRCMQEYRSANAEHREEKNPEYWRDALGLPTIFQQLPYLHDKGKLQGLWHYNPN